VTPLSDALTAAQRSALAALEKAYVAGEIEEREDFAQALGSFGVTDTVDIVFLLAALDVLREWGVASPTMTERVVEANDLVTDKQKSLILSLCDKANLPAPDFIGLTKDQASRAIDALQAGKYDSANYSVPF
jgi:hypothetical protein